MLISDARSIAITSERTSVSILTLVLTGTLAVVQAVNLLFPAISRRRQTNVEIVAGDLHHRTQSVKWKEGKITRWDSKLDLYAFISLVNIYLMLRKFTLA